MGKNCFHKRAYTLIELLIYMALFSIFLIILTQIFVSVLEVSTESEAVSNVDQDGNYIMARLLYDINRSNGITQPNTPGAGGNALAMSIGGVTYTYQLNNDVLYLTDNTGTYRLNSNNTDIVATQIFTRRGAGDAQDPISVSFTVRSRIKLSKGTESKVFSTTIASRQ